MASKSTQHTVTIGAQVAVGLIILAFVVAAIAFAIFGMMPTNHEPSTGETTYRVIGDTFKMDRIVADVFSISMEAARIVSHVMVAILCLLVAAFFVQLFLILGSARRGEPFSGANATRLFRMGWIVLFAIAAKITRLSLAGEALDSGQVVQSILLVAVGLSFLVIGHVFRLGTQMRDDLEGTV